MSSILNMKIVNTEFIIGIMIYKRIHSIVIAEIFDAKRYIDVSVL